MAPKDNKNVKMVIMRSDGKTYDSLDEVFQEIAELAADCGGDCENCPEAPEHDEFREMAENLYGIYEAFQQAGFTPKQAFHLLLAGMA